eukprot:Awhi_evm1s4317
MEVSANSLDSVSYFSLLPKLNVSKINEDCVTWNERVAISDGITNYGKYKDSWYGYRIAQVKYGDGVQRLWFYHGKDDPFTFYLRPEDGDVTRTGCIKEHDLFHLETHKSEKGTLMTDGSN